MDVDFYTTLNNQNQAGPDIEMLDQLIYNPFEDGSDDIPDELDPDQNFYQTYNNPNSKSCKYYYPDRINPKILNIPDNSLAMLHLNVRS